ncbi:SapC family protein [Hyphococcus flavus]|uniref:SapC family protein n=1 Tax=Hyphococcus flavus TaxID=1866326 RepID=A0AAE9ZIB4_9PROT|nr:SapC family protein [Hyphococcus flavus]WDI33217.1 SapC family protein [Hyphococcus flavus]
MSEAQPVPQVTGRMFLYEKPELLTKEEHGELKVKQSDSPFAFAAKARAIPITYSEIPSAMKNFPLIFMSKEQPQMLAVTGLYDDINLFVGDDGKWEDHTYVPGYIRRYPFGLANESEGDRLAVIIDRAFDGFATNGDGAPLFKDGELTEETARLVEFCKGYEQDRSLTEQFVRVLQDNELIQAQTAQYTPIGSSDAVDFASYFSIDEKRLNELPDEKLLEIRKSGMLPLVYGMLMSMGNWRLLLQRRAKRFDLQDGAIFKPLATN